MPELYLIIMYFGPTYLWEVKLPTKEYVWASCTTTGRPSSRCVMPDNWSWRTDSQGKIPTGFTYLRPSHDVVCGFVCHMMCMTIGRADHIVV